jgi:two-component system LytT family response regulator
VTPKSVATSPRPTGRCHPIAESPWPGRLAIKSGGRIIFHRAEDIDWVEASASRVRLHIGGNTYRVHETMNSMEQRLDSSKFVRIHRSAIVNVDRITQLEVLPHGEYVITLRDHTRLRSSRTFSRRVRALLR